MSDDEVLYGSGADVHRTRPATFDTTPPQYPEVGWKYEVRSIVRRGMADVLEWLGEDAPRELPDEQEWEKRWVRGEQRLAYSVMDPSSMIRLTGFV